MDLAQIVHPDIRLAPQHPAFSTLTRLGVARKFAAPIGADLKNSEGGMVGEV